MAERSAMMDQYRRIKARYRDAVLFFRLGDFYEMFFDDAIEVSALLDLTLTQRQGEPMCGIPYHAAKPYIARLLRLGKKVAVCEQLGEAGPGKGLVERDVVEVVTPGTTVEEDFLDQAANSYLMAVCHVEGRLCVAYLDLSTGEFRAHSRPFSLDSADAEPPAAEFLRSELYRLGPRELLVQQSLLDRPLVGQAVAEAEDCVVNRYPDWSFDAERSSLDMQRRFGLASLKGFGFDDSAPELAAAGTLLRYVDETAKASTPHLGPPLPYRADEFVGIDEGSRKNLELVRNLADSGRAFSLLSVLDSTRTAPGARLMRQWLLQPLHSRKGIEERLDAVDFLYRNQRLLASLRDVLGKTRDIERLASRVAMDKAHARDLLALRESIDACFRARKLLAAEGAPDLLVPALDGAAAEACAAISQRIATALRDEPSILLSEGGLIRAGHSEELDRLQALKERSREILDAYVEEERAASGIGGLKVRYNKIIGYYLEVAKNKADSVPSHFIRRQSLLTGERFTTTRLSELESEINGATERIVELERELFLELRAAVRREVPTMLLLGRSAAVQDCLASFAWTATSRGYSRPRIVDPPVLRIVEGRHPVVEAHLGEGSFVPNGVELDSSAERGADIAGAAAPAFALITGPNMAGKSTYLRQNALIALMAHAGSFVPALDAEIGLIDKIFCRVGAQDNLARGESTFLVEMHETAFILNTASAASLVVMDEVGRGTSTLDGLAIAWAVAESLLDRIRCRSLFATHYHELTAIEHPRLGSFSMAVLEEEGEVVFLKHIEPGPAKGSYGLHVARLAGVPDAVLRRAAEIQSELARAERNLPAAAGRPVEREAGGGGRQAALFSADELVLAELRSIDVDSMTPREALNRLAILQSHLQAE